MKTKLLIPIISGIFLLIATIITVVFSNNSSQKPISTTVQVHSSVDKSTQVDKVENLTINQ